MENRTMKLHRLITEYAEERELYSVKTAIDCMQRIVEEEQHTESFREKLRQALAHSYEVCVIIMDLHPDLTQEEEDILYAGILLHTYPENFSIENLKDRLVTKMGFSEKVCELVGILLPGRNMTDVEMQHHYARVQENKLALLAALADRGHVVQEMYRMSTWNANRCIEETKMCFYPMGIYGKEHYHELLPPIIVLLEKMRTLLDASEILLRRYETREAELIREIQMLQEENAVVRGIIEEYCRSEA